MGVISEIKKKLRENHGVVVCKKGLVERQYGEIKNVETQGRELLCFLEGAKQLYHNYRVAIILRRGKKFVCYEDSRDCPFGQDYNSNINL